VYKGEKKMKKVGMIAKYGGAQSGGMSVERLEKEFPSTRLMSNEVMCLNEVYDKLNEIIDYINADCRGPEVTE